MTKFKISCAEQADRLQELGIDPNEVAVEHDSGDLLVVLHYKTHNTIMIEFAQGKKRAAPDGANSGKRQNE